MILVLEVSTTSAKALGYDPIQGITTLLSDELLPEYNDKVTQDADGILRQITALARRAAEGRNVEIIALSGTWHSLLLLDCGMTPLTRAFLWSYRGAADIEKRCRADEAFTRRFYRTTGCTVGSTYPVFKLMKLRESGYDTKECCIASLGAYLYYRLTGCFAESESMASGSGLMDLRTGAWSEESLALAGVSSDRLGRIVSFRETAPLSAEGAALLGLPAGVPVIAAYPDGALNQVGEGALAHGRMTFSVGTSAAIRLSAPQPAFSDTYATWCYRSPTSYLVGAATSGASNCVDWIKEKLFDADVSYAALESEAMDPAATPVFLPFLFGERSPGWNGDRQASFHDVRPEHGKKEMYFSVLEGVLFHVYQCFQELCDIGGKPEEILLSGGILHSRVWTQMAADLFGVPLTRSRQKQASLLGGAALGMAALGPDSAVAHGIAAIGAAGEPAVPDPQATARYRAKYERYLHWYRDTSRG